MSPSVAAPSALDTEAMCDRVWCTFSRPELIVVFRALCEADDVSIDVHIGGANIAGESLERIFEPMVRLDPNGDASKLSGSRVLGLFVAREIVTAHGRALTARSDGSGTVFMVRLPREAPAPE